MSLRDKIKKMKAADDKPQRTLFLNYGVIDNPFPAAGQPFGHPHLKTDVDDEIDNLIEDFELYGLNTQVIVITGTQGVGKTNLLTFYQNELEDLHEEDKTFYIIRYYPDPEPSFDSIVRRIVQELGEIHLTKIAKSLKDLSRTELSRVVDTVRNHEVKLVMYSLARAAQENISRLNEVCVVALEWFLGLRIFKRHKEELGIYFRLDTIESKTQALRDLIYISVNLNTLKGIFLLLDELEKQDYSLSKTSVIRYLSAIRALIDALPTNLFLMMALTPEARRRYFLMLPAIAGRLQNVFALSPLKKSQEAVGLYNLYLENAKNKAQAHTISRSCNPGNDRLLEKEKIMYTFKKMLGESAERGLEGVTHRDFLNQLHTITRTKFNDVLKV